MAERGGKLLGAGQRGNLSLSQRWTIGSMCEERWQEAAAARALEKYERDGGPTLANARHHQNLFNSFYRGSAEAQQRSSQAGPP